MTTSDPTTTPEPGEPTDAATPAAAAGLAGPVEVLDTQQCWQLLGTQTVGRLVTSAAGHIDIVPINYRTDGQRLLFRTAEGTKLVELTINDRIVFEVDHITPTSGWSVVLRGTARILATSAEIAAADNLDIPSWVPTPKHNIVEIHPTTLTGRYLHFDADPT